MRIQLQEGNTFLKVIFLILFFLAPISFSAKAQAIEDNANNDSSSSALSTADDKARTLAKPGEQISPTLLQINYKLDTFEQNFEVLQEKLSKETYSSAFIGFMGVVVGAVLSVFTTIWVQKNQTRFQINKSLVDWKLQQISELYGPLYALLRQSNSVYRQMNKALSEHDKKRFRLKSDNNAIDFDDARFEINIDGEWKVFRSATHLKFVYCKDFGVDQYFDEIISIGEKIVNVIQEKAGFVRADQAELADVFGSYLAHFVLLRQIYSNLKDSILETRSLPQEKTSIDDSAAFPCEIQGLIKAGFERLNRELKKWDDQGNIAQRQ